MIMHDMDKTAKVILDMLNTEAMTMVHVAYGTDGQRDQGCVPFL